MTSKETIDGTRGGVRTEPVRLHRMPFHDWTTDADFTTFKTVHHGAGLADYDAPRFIDVDFGGPAPLSFTNLLIGTTYEWTGTKADGTVVSGAFTTENVPPRTLYVPVGNTGATVKNVRDLGGWPLMGRTAAGLTAIRQGVLYRGANADAFIDLSASEKAANPLHAQLGVVTEIDLRGDNDPLATEGASPICPAIRYSYCPMTDNTLGGGDTFTNALRQVFRTLSSEDALPAYFHCKIGCDRTGIVAALILGICGVRLTWLFLVFPHFNTLPAVYVCYPISWTVSILLQIPMWHKVHKDIKARV